MFLLKSIFTFLFAQNMLISATDFSQECFKVSNITTFPLFLLSALLDKPKGWQTCREKNNLLLVQCLIK